MPLPSHAGPRPPRSRRPEPRRGYSPWGDRAAGEADALRVRTRPSAGCSCLVPSRPGYPRLGDQFLDHHFGPALAVGEALAQGDKIDFTFILRAFVEGAESGPGLGHHVEGEPGAAVFLVAIPGVDFRLAQFLKLLVRHSGNVVISLVHIASTLASSSDRSTAPRATTALPAARAAPVKGSP